LRGLLRQVLRPAATGDSGVPSQGRQQRGRLCHSRKLGRESAATSSAAEREWLRPRRIPGRCSNRALVSPDFHRQFCEVLVKRDVADPRIGWRAGPGFGRACCEQVNANPSPAWAPTPPARGAQGPDYAARVVRLRKPPADKLIKWEKEGVPAGALPWICQRPLRTPRSLRP